MKYFSIDDLKKTFNIEGDVDISLIKEACKMLNIKFFGGGVFFFDPCDKKEDETEFDQMYRKFLLQVVRISNQIVLCEKLNKPNTNLVYYKLISFGSSNIEDIKKILKIHKLKAFL